MNLRSKLKSSIFHSALAGLAFWSLLNPVVASAGMFTFFSSFITQSQAASTGFNSQTLPLLTPATNIDPRPAVGGGNISFLNGTALVPQEGPDGTVDESAAAGSSAISIYTVHKGDTLKGIATMFGVTSNTIVWANNLPGGVIHEGDQLIILPVAGVRYVTAKGDTIASIAKKYKGDANEIAQYNNLGADGLLAEGTVLIIPNGEAPPTAAQVAVTVHTKIINRIKKGGTEPFLGGSGPSLVGYYSWPVNGGVLTQGLHGWNGIDIGAPTGTGIVAAAGGTVIVAKGGGGWNGGYGNYVVVSHPNGTQTLYAHMSKVLVSSGDAVDQGDTIGKIGTTGASTGPHLHFEVRGAVNPFAN